MNKASPDEERRKRKEEGVIERREESAWAEVRVDGDSLFGEGHKVSTVWSAGGVNNLMCPREWEALKIYKRHLTTGKLQEEEGRWEFAYSESLFRKLDAKSTVKLV